MKKIFNLILALTLMFGAFAAQPAQAAAESPATEQASASPKDFITEDGTLKSDIDFRGALDLEGWDVTLDPEQGPIFSQAVGDWGGLGGGGVFNRYIQAIVVDGTDIYVGGLFQNAGGNPEADYIAKWNGNEWQALGSNGNGDGALNSIVYSMLLIGSDLYVGGRFSYVKDTNNTPIQDSQCLAVWSGSAWSAPGITSDIACDVFAMAYDSDNGYLYIGGDFENLNGMPEADAVVRLRIDTSSWAPLGSDGNGGGSINGYVYTVALDSIGNVYVGGDFVNVNNGGTPIPEADYIVRWDGNNWFAMGDNGSSDGAVAGEVYAIAVDANDHAYVGGWFENAAGIPAADYIAKWDGNEWQVVGDGNLNFWVDSIIIDNEDIYIGGGFTDADGIAEADRIVRFDASTGDWFALGDNGAEDGALKGPIYSGMTLSDGKVYVGGDFYDLNNEPHADHFAIWDGNNWSTLGNSPDGGLRGAVHAIAFLGSDVYVGGTFTNVGSDPRIDYLARWDGTNWHPVGNLTQTNGAIRNANGVQALAVSGNDLYIGGNFGTVQNEGVSVVGARHIVRWDGSQFHNLSNNGGSDGSLNGIVNTIAVSGADVYVGGTFFNVNNGGTLIPEADYIARWDGTDWHSLSGNGASNGAISSGSVNAIVVHNNEIYVGGNFGDNVKNTANQFIPFTQNLARWDGSVWSVVPGRSALFNGAVHALALSNDRLYVGGDFTDANNIPGADRVVAVDLASGVWSMVGSTNAFNSAVRAILASGDDVFIGGEFTDAAGIPEADYIVKWNGTAFSALGNNGSGNGSLNNTVRAIRKSGTILYIGGNFVNVSNNGVPVPTADYAATYNLGNNISTFKSAATQDGWVLESAETSGKGGTLNKKGKTLLIGDDATNKQYRAILSFATASLPDDADITKVTLKVKRQGITGGGNPITIFGGFFVDIKTGNFGTAGLQLADFQTKGSKTYGAFKPKAASGGWYSINLTTGKDYINKLGNTQIRLRFKTDDNNDFIANFLSIHSGNASSASRPQLIVEFSTP